MIIKSIEINNFRNIKNSFFEPNKDINVIFGNNANGKTSFIESIYSVSNLKSFRTSNLSETINIENNKAIIKCFIENNKIKENIKLEIKSKSKKYFKNNNNNKLDDYLWSLFSIVFIPDDILLINGPPLKKRELIDKAIFYTDKNYLKTLKNYHKIIINKNINLKNNKVDEIENWNILIAKYSSIIVNIRNKYIDRIYYILDKKTDLFKLKYEIVKNINLEDNELYDYFINELNNNLDKEIKYKYSLVGAHKQNIDFNIDGKNLKVFGSQGQKRTFILLFRHSQIIDFEDKHNFVPVLLLDDMASELDHTNKNIFFNILENFSGQIFITTTEKKIVSNSKKVNYFCVENGKINPFF